MSKAPVKKSLGDDEIIRIARIAATQAAAAGYIEVAHDTQLSIERGVIWMIHWVEFYGQDALDDIAQGDDEVESFQITRESKAAIVVPSNADLLAYHVKHYKRWATIGTDAGPLLARWEDPKCLIYKPALCFAAMNIYFGYQSTHASAKTAYARIGYSIRHVSDQYFYRVAQALLA